MRKPQISGKSREYRDTIVFEKLCFQTGVFRPKTKSRRFQIPPLEERFRKAPFRDGLVWTLGLTVEMKLRFQIPLRRVEAAL